MPTTVLDSFVLEIGLDPSKFTAGQQETMRKWREITEGSASAAAAIEAQGSKVVDAFAAMKRATLEAVGIFLGGMGVKEFTSYLTNLDATTARVAKTMDVSTRELSAWQGAARQLGGTAEGITGTLQSLSSEVNKFNITGQSSILGVLTPLGVSLQNANGQLKTSTELFLDIADAVQGMDPAKARAMLSLLGMDQDAINLAIKGRREIEGYLDAARKAGLTTEESAQAASEFQRQLALVNLEATNLGRTLFNSVAPGLQLTLTVLQHLSDSGVWSTIGHGLAVPFKQAIAVVDEMIAKIYDARAAALSLSPFGTADAVAAARASAEEYRRSAQSWRAGADESRRSAIAGQTGQSGGYNVPTSVIRQKIVDRATAWGIDPQTAVTVAEHEGLFNYRSTVPGEDSVGPFQLHYGGGLGDTFTQETGLDAHDPSTLDAQIEFVMSHLRRTGWGPYHGAAAAGIGPRRGIGITTTPLPPLGPGASSAQHSSLGGNRGGDMNVQVGDIHINAPGGSSDAIASEIGTTLRRAVQIAGWNSGLA